MHDPRRVGLGEPLRRLGQVPEEGPQVGLVLVDQGGQRLAAHQLHRDVVDRVRVASARLAHRVLPDLVDRHDVRVAERRRRLGLEHEAPDPLLAPHELGREDLQRDAALEGPVLREVDLAHAARAERGDDAVVRDLVLGAQRSLGLACHLVLRWGGEHSSRRGLEGAGGGCQTAARGHRLRQPPRDPLRLRRHRGLGGAARAGHRHHRGHGRGRRPRDPRGPERDPLRLPPHPGRRPAEPREDRGARPPRGRAVSTDHRVLVHCRIGFTARSW